MTHLIIPKQESTSDTVAMTHEEVRWAEHCTQSLGVMALGQ